MTLPRRCLVPLAWLLAAAAAVAQTPPPAPSAAPPSPFAGDERAARLAERYQAMFTANPAEGIALDRLWSSYVEHNATANLIADFQREADRHDSAPGWLAYGYVLKKAGRLDDADFAFSRAAKVDPHGFLPPLARGELASARNKPDEAAPFITDALMKLPPNDRRRGDLLLKLGGAWLAAGHPEKAAENWEQITALDPANHTLRRQLAETYAKSHLTDKALVHYGYIAEHAESAARAAALRELGRLHESRGEFDAARDAFEQGMALTSRDNWLNGELQAALIRLYQRAGRAPELESRWRQAVEQTPRGLGGFLRLEALAEAQGDLPARVQWLEKVVSLAPRDRESRLKLARLLVESGQRERAAAAYDQLLAEQPDHLDLIFARADLDLQMGDPAAATLRVERRLAKSPADETVAAPALEFFLAHHLDEAAEQCLRAVVQRQSAALEPAVALAKFYFARRRTDEARRVLADLAARPGDARQRAARWQRLAETYKDANLPDEALQCWRAVAALSPGNAAPLVAASELLLSQGDAPAAAAELQNALVVSPEAPGREEIERRLFQVLAAGYERGEKPTVDASTSRPGGRLRVGPSLVAPSWVSRVETGRSKPLDEYLASLAEVATSDPSTANVMRLARWQWWAHAPEEAALSAEDAIRRDPMNVPARQLLVGVAVETHQFEIAERRLREIMEIDPGRRVACLRQLAGLQLDGGNFDSALAILTDLQQAQPGALEPLTELALAQQRADRWFDALDSWKLAAGLGSLTPAQRADVRRPLVAAYEHLGEYRPAAETLQAAGDQQTELGRKQDLFKELADFCGKHALATWLAEQYETRLKEQPEDYFTLIAVADLRQGQGKEWEAYGLRRRAFYSAPDPAAALKSLADEAESLGDDDQAAVDRSRLIAMAGQNTAENLEKLASLEEANLNEAEATRLWEQVAGRFPRDTTALAHAAEYFERIGQSVRARDLGSRIVALAPADLPRLFHLGTLELEAGRQDDARARFEQVLAQSNPEKPGDALRLPPDLDVAVDPSVAFAAGTTFAKTLSGPVPPPDPASAPGDDRTLRLQAIRELARLLPPPTDPSPAPGPGTRDARRLWLDRWVLAAAAGARSEPLEALYSAGESAHTLDLLTRWMARQPADDALRGTFLLAGLRLGEYGRLAHWTWSEGNPLQSSERGAQLVAALQQFLATGGKPDGALVKTLFPPEVRARNLYWKAAAEGFVERRWYAQAAELGEIVFAQVTSGRAAYAVELVKWELYLGRADRARSILRAAIDEGGGASLDTSGGSAVFEALREYYLLLPEQERPRFVESYLRTWRERGDTVHACLSAVLLHGLAGDQPAARRDLDALLASRHNGEEIGGDSSEARRWSYLLNNGTQLPSWNLDGLATYLWRSALRESNGFDRMNTEVQSIQAEMRNRLVSLEVVQAADPQTAREKMATYLHGSPPIGQVISLATQMMASSQYPAARQIDEWLAQLEPGEGDFQRNLLGACEAAGDTDAVEQILTALVTLGRRLPAAMIRTDLICRLAALREKGGDTVGSRRLLEQALASGPASALVVSQLTQQYQSVGMLDEAARVWREGMATDPANARNYRLTLAALEEQRGNFPAAILLVEPEATVKTTVNASSGKARLARLFLLAGRTQDAKNLAEGYLRANELESLASVAQVFGDAGQRSPAREWLAAAVRRSRDPQARFQLQRQLLQQCLEGDEVPMADFLREMRRLKKFAGVSASLRSAYDFARYELAQRRGATEWLEGELRQDWRDGQGDFFAGERLVHFYLESKQAEKLRQVVSAIDRRPNLPEQSLYSMEKRLMDGGYAALALPVAERLFRRFPQNEAYALGRARVLWKAGQPAAAHEVLDALDRTYVFHGDLSLQIASLYQELGDTEGMRNALVHTVERNPNSARAIPAYLRLAQIETGRKNWLDARRLLRSVCRFAPSDDLSELVDYLQASGQLDGDLSRALPFNDFPLTFTQRAQLMAAIYMRLKTTRRPDAARAMALGHPELLAGPSRLSAALGRDAEPSQFPLVAAALQQAITQAEAPVPRLNRDLAAVYLRWSDQEVNDGRDGSEARLEHLSRANELSPEDFEIARRLATLCWETNQAARAVEILQPFLAPDAVPVEREQVRALLAKH